MKHDHTVLELVSNDQVALDMRMYAREQAQVLSDLLENLIQALEQKGAEYPCIMPGYTGGLSKVIGPTGGYMIGYIPLAFCTGWFAEKHRSNVILTVAGMLIGTIILYALGTVWLAFQMKMDLKAALGAGVLPFLPGDAAKIVITQVLGPILYTALKKGGVLTK